MSNVNDFAWWVLNGSSRYFSFLRLAVVISLGLVIRHSGSKSALCTCALCDYHDLIARVLKVSPYPPPPRWSNFALFLFQFVPDASSFCNGEICVPSCSSSPPRLSPFQSRTQLVPFQFPDLPIPSRTITRRHTYFRTSTSSVRRQCSISTIIPALHAQVLKPSSYWFFQSVSQRALQWWWPKEMPRMREVLCTIVYLETAFAHT